MAKPRTGYRFLILLLLVSTLLGGSALAVPPEDNVSKFCASVNDMGQTHGGCVASLTSGNLTPNIANFCRDPVVRAEAAELAGEEEVNHGQCMQILREFFGA
ncbi:MAG TPA: hypothetical protein VHJ78_09995 [Actinomycetota bacterium]|nr:hypothetical protein [Actinomycetota bacterium]